ncbi:MAG: tRNA guanosine(15) transglycosylase TgtA [Candidatus Helarchaeota archaeon]
MFELIGRDAAGRLGRFKTAHGSVLTPTLMPVYNPNIPLIPAKELEKDFKIQMLITNAYIIYRTPKLKERASEGIHQLINFHNTIMTDSGAYQAWMYQTELGVTNREIIEFEELLEPDIATILDVFTETNDYQISKTGVEKTLQAAEECLQIRTKEKILWAAPVQGGQFLDLLKYCAKKLSSLDFDLHPLGTLAPSLQSYNYKQVAETILVTKQNLIPSRPLHGFSIGHPNFLALAVAFGVDLFDSSAYALFAKNNRYLTVNKTLHLETLEEFPCMCPVCSKFNPQDLKEMSTTERRYLLAKHNLYATIDELRKIRVAIRENWLWELVQERIRAHPRLFEAFMYNLSKYSEFFLKVDPITKKTGFFYSGSESLFRPEVKRYVNRLLNNYTPSSKIRVMVLIPDLEIRSENAPQFRSWVAELNQHPNRDQIHLCFYSPIFGIIPEELQEIYPLCQHEYPKIYDNEMTLHAKEIFSRFLKKYEHFYKICYLFRPKHYFNLKNQKQDLVYHPIDEILEYYDSESAIFHQMIELKTVLDDFFKI